MNLEDHFGIRSINEALDDFEIYQDIDNEIGENNSL